MSFVEYLLLSQMTTTPAEAMIDFILQVCPCHMILISPLTLLCDSLQKSTAELALIHDDDLGDLLKVRIDHSTLNDIPATYAPSGKS